MNDVAHQVALAACFDHDTRAAAAHDGAELDRGQVARCVVHPCANGGIDAQHGDFDERLAVTTARARRRDESRGRLVDGPARAMIKHDLAIVHEAPSRW